MQALRAWLVLPLALVALSGCLGDEETVETVDPDPGTLAPLWILDAARNNLTAADFSETVPSFELVKASDRISGEPTIGITRQGTIFYPAIDFDAVRGLPKTVYMRSTDGGSTWEETSPKMAGVETHPTSFDPYVYVDPTTGRVFAMDMGPHVACNKVSWSDDEGETWVTRDGACIPGINDHPTIFAGPATAATNTAVYPNQVYICTNQITDSICYQSPDGGINWIATAPAYLGYDPERWQPPSEPSEAGVVRSVFSGLCGGLHGHGHASWADGTVYLGRDWCGEPSVAVSHDGGLTFTKVRISDDPKHSPSEHDVSIGTDTAGTAYALWLGDKARSAYLSVSKDKGLTWSEPANVTAPGVTAMKFPSLVAGSEGRIAFLYVGTENPYGNDAGKLREGCIDRSKSYCYEYPDAYNNSTWNAYVGISLNGDSEEAVFVTTMANAADEPLKRGTCSGRCFGDKGGMYDFLDIDIDPTSGSVYLALVDVCSGECDGPGKGKFDVQEHSVGTVARQLGGVTLLAEPLAERK
ncbi:MAG: glycoside hydrolase [Euryarchaeota archaeon]|nr:glycoside hydrolase [Euryarchaeota archaeon]